MSEIENTTEFSVFGGPLNKLGQKSGLIKAHGNSTVFGIVIGFSMWILLLIFSLIGGKIAHFFSIDLIASHVRFLIAIPLFFICEAMIAPPMAKFVDYLKRSRLVPENELPKFAETIDKINKAKESWIVEGILFLLMFVFPLFITNNILPGHSTTVNYVIHHSGGHVTLANAFYLWFCLPLFRFLILRWFWHLGLWWYFLYKLNKLKLNLIPTHSDGAGGLGYLEVVHGFFAPLVLAISAVIATSTAEGVITGTLAFESLAYLIPVTLVINLLLFVAPLFIFFLKLKYSRLDGLKDYMIMATRYVDAFDTRWIKNKTETGESQLGSADIQALADLTTSTKVIYSMQIVPASVKLVKALAIRVLIPFLPFVFMKFNFKELMALTFKLISGA